MQNRFRSLLFALTRKAFVQKSFRLLFISVGQILYWLGIILLWVVGWPIGFALVMLFYLFSWIGISAFRFWAWVWRDDKKTIEEFSSQIAPP